MTRNHKEFSAHETKFLHKSHPPLFSGLLGLHEKVSFHLGCAMGMFTSKELGNCSAGVQCTNIACDCLLIFRFVHLGFPVTNSGIKLQSPIS